MRGARQEEAEERRRTRGAGREEAEERSSEEPPPDLLVAPPCVAAAHRVRVLTAETFHSALIRPRPSPLVGTCGDVIPVGFLRSLGRSVVAVGICPLSGAV
ncbi:unnamed protein product [Ranitomeya imitator]|uniref:Uncharacterized protein n=1 Tax=Ranitomeya imitator TaxID=111125 RepID=A0ABN9MP04_9NEOB|nr:unnamed protein product [Ranitomeya imitator]